MIRDKVIYGDKVYLRPMNLDDGVKIVQWRNDPEIQRWMFNQKELSLADHINWWHSNKDSLKRVDYIICDKINNNSIGTLNFTNIENNQAEAGKMLGDKSYWGKGFAKESFLLWLGFGFKDLGLNKIYIRTMINNKTNIALNEKLGFKIREQSNLTYGDGVFNVLTMELNKIDIIW